MAAVGKDQLQCSICLNLFTEPVTTSCGHSFCRACLSQHWDTSTVCKCPLCNQLFCIKPDLKVNTVLSDLVSQFEQEQSRSQEFSKPGEVSCDHCSTPKLKALKSCLVCLSSYCEKHLQPHLSVARLKTHQLVDPVDNIEDRMCPQHHKPLELFCQSDHSCLCTMCALLEHKNHQYVTLNEQVNLQKVSLRESQQQSRNMVEQRRKKIKEVQSSVQLSQRAADRERSIGLQVFTALIESVQRSRESFLHELQEKQKQTQTQAEALVKQLNQEICELEKRSTETEQFLRSEDHFHFLQHCPELKPLTGLKDWSSVSLTPQMFEPTAAQALFALERNLKETFMQEINKVPKLKLSSLQQFAADLTLDPGTANMNLLVSTDQKQVSHTDQVQFRDSPRRFSWRIVFCKQSFSSGKFYFEVQVKNKTLWTLGVARESVERKTIKDLTSPHGFWCVYKKNVGEYVASTEPPLTLSLKCSPQKVGVFVDYDQGLVSFYDVDTADLIYSFTGCTFREKLFPFLNPCYNFDGINSAPLVLTAVNSPK